MEHKKTVFWTIIAIGLVGLLLFLSSHTLINNNDKENAPAASQQTTQITSVSACELFSIDDARQVLGESAEKPEDLAGADASSDDMEVTQCLYEVPPAEAGSADEQKQASLLARSAKTDSGARSNEEVFSGAAKPANVEDVSGYGDAAFWNPEFGQLNILKGSNWYILQVGGSVPSERTLDEAKQLADVLISSL